MEDIPVVLFCFSGDRHSAVKDKKGVLKVKGKPHESDLRIEIFLKIVSGSYAGDLVPHFSQGV